MPSNAVRVLGASVDTSDSVAQRYGADHSFSFPIVRLGSPRWIGVFRAPAVPTILLVDSEGKIVFARSGELRKRAGVDSLMAVIATHADSLQAVAAMP